MSSNESHQERRTARPRRRPERLVVEGLETRQLLAYSPFGFSLPDLAVTGYSAPTAAWGGPLSINVDVQNLGASSLIEPTHLEPGAVSTADAPATAVTVLASPRPNGRGGLVELGTIAIPAIKQNGEFETVSTITLPSRPANFPDQGGRIFLTLVVNNGREINETTTRNNVFRVPTVVKVADALPNLQVVALDIPSTLVPGQVISPTVRVANLGAGNPALQGPVVVQVVASLNKTFGPGDAVVASYTIDNLPGISAVPSKSKLTGDDNVIPPPNINTTTLAPFKLPTTPNRYFLGIVIDPFATIKQSHAPNAKLKAAVKVGPPDAFLPSGNLLATTNGQVPIFPAPPSSIINPIVGTPNLVTPIVTIPVFVRNTASKASARNKG